MHSSDVRLRSTYTPGDWGWVIERHGTLYAAEHGWGQRFETRIARLVTEFARAYDPDHDHFWFAERAGQRLGSLFLERASDAACELRFFLVDPNERGSGIGRRLVEACLARARTVGYTRLVLATHADLVSARRIYASVGFSQVSTIFDEEFGEELEHWEMNLG